MVRTLQFAPSTPFPLVRTCKYTQPRAIYRWGQNQFHHSSTPEWILVRSDGVRVRRLFLLGKDFLFWWLSCEFTVFLLTLFMSLWSEMLVSSKSTFSHLYSWYHCTCYRYWETSPRWASYHFALPSCGLSQKPWLLLSSSFSSVPLHFPLLYLYAQLLCMHTWARNVFYAVVGILTTRTG